MREYKYRIWDEENKEFVYFNLRRLVGHWSGIIFDPEEPSTESSGREGIAGESGARSLLKTAPLDQFTGRTDKNGKDIYENDILLNPNRVEKYQHILIDDFDQFIYDDLERMMIVSETEVLGNIYENPELLK